MSDDTIMLTGGGTGGHVFPMVAVADELRRLSPRLRLIFVGTERGIERQVVPDRGYELELVRLDPLRGRGPVGALKSLKTAAASIPEALGLLRKYRPKVVFSIGGYAAGTIALGAKLLGIPLALMEPNSVIGLANRLVAPLVTRAYTSFPEVERHFFAPTVARTGLAIRRGFQPQPYSYDGERLRVLVLGGSQGAVSLNETVPLALARASAPLSVVHQAGNGKDQAVRELYQGLGATSDNEKKEHVQIVPFIRDVASALAGCDVVIGRSGAGAVSEVCAVGRPGLYIPYPYASGDHQYKNAMSLVKNGAALCIAAQDAGERAIAAAIDGLHREPPRLRAMAAAAASLGRPEAALTVAEDLLDLAKLRPTATEDDFELSTVSPSSEVH